MFFATWKEQRHQAKYTAVFDRLYAELIRRDPSDVLWELIDLSPSEVLRSWSDFTYAAPGTAAFRPLTIEDASKKHRQY